MTVSKFISGDRTYIEQAAEYLDARGLTIQQLPVEPYRMVDLGFYTKRKGGSEMYEPLPLEGWAFQIRKPDGGYYEDRWLLRVCNWPKEQIYQRRGGRMCVVSGNPPKFVQISPKGADLTSFISGVDELCHSKVVMFHEKFTSAALAVNLLGFPSIALSGCTNWSENGRIKDNVKYIIENMEPSAKLVVCFDGDLLNNPNVMHAASQLKGWVHSMRKDIDVIFPPVPTMPDGKNGWDDWVVMQGDDAADNWSMLLAGEGVQVTTALPLQYLVQEYQVKTKALKDKIVIEHTAANYARLLRHPIWEAYTRDTMGGVYNKNHLQGGRLTMDDMYRAYEMWLADTVFVGDGANVRSSQVKDAVRSALAHRQEPVVYSILSDLPEVSEEEAYLAAERLVTEGIRVTGPMTLEETKETIIRVYRDMVAMWSDDIHVDAQWALVLIGPSGCGKSNFPKSVANAIEQFGYSMRIGQLAKEGNKSNIDELLRQCRDCHIGVFDEYNPDDKNARIVEQNLFTLSTQRTFTQRKLHEEDNSDQVRHATVMLTTVDKNQKFIRSTRGAGERRFIILNVEGVRVGNDGKMTSNRELITQLSLTLFRYGYQRYLAGDRSGAAEFSVNHTDSYVSSSPIEVRLAQHWSRHNASFEEYLDKFKDTFLREHTGDIRFSGPQLFNLLVPPGEKTYRQEQADLINLVLECGAKDIGKSRVNTADGGEVLKDRAYAVTLSGWDAFKAALMDRLG